MCVGIALVADLPNIWGVLFWFHDPTQGHKDMRVLMVKWVSLSWNPPQDACPMQMIHFSFIFLFYPFIKCINSLTKKKKTNFLCAQNRNEGRPIPIRFMYSFWSVVSVRIALRKKHVLSCASVHNAVDQDRIPVIIIIVCFHHCFCFMAP